MNCETDFVARTEKFRALLHDVTHQIMEAAPKDRDELMQQKLLKNPSVTVEELQKETIANLGENISIRRFERYQGASFAPIFMAKEKLEFCWNYIRQCFLS